MSPITTHILDTSLGRPAEGIFVTLDQHNDDDESWETLAVGVTNGDGRIADLLERAPLSSGTYRLIFALTQYFELQKIKSFYPQVTIEFQIVDPAQHYHVPLLLSPFGYSTYRGS